MASISHGGRRRASGMVALVLLWLLVAWALGGSLLWLRGGHERDDASRARTVDAAEDVSRVTPPNPPPVRRPARVDPDPLACLLDESSGHLRTRIISRGCFGGADDLIELEWSRSGCTVDVGVSTWLAHPGQYPFRLPPARCRTLLERLVGASRGFDLDSDLIESDAAGIVSVQLRGRCHGEDIRLDLPRPLPAGALERWYRDWYGPMFHADDGGAHGIWNIWTTLLTHRARPPQRHPSEK